MNGEPRPRSKGEKWFAGFVIALWTFGFGMEMGERLDGAGIYVILTVFVLEIAYVFYALGAEREWRRQR